MLTSATAERMAASSSGEGVNACGHLFGQSFFGCLKLDVIFMKCNSSLGMAF